MRSSTVWLAALVAVVVLEAMASRAQAQRVTPLGNPAQGGRPVTLTVPASLAARRAIAYTVNNEAQPALPVGQSRTHTPRNGSGVRIRFYNGTSNATGRPRVASYRVYGGRYAFAVNSTGQALVLTVNGAPVRAAASCG